MTSTSCVIIRCILLSRYHQRRVKQMPVDAVSAFVNNGWLEVDKDDAWDMLSGARFKEEGIEGVIDRARLLHHAIWGDVVLEAVQLPAGVLHLAPAYPTWMEMLSR